MQINNNLSTGMISLKLEFIQSISFEAQGILSQMVNLPNCDHITIKQFHNKFPAGNITELKKAFKELENKGYIYRDSKGSYVVNKISLVRKMHWIEPNNRKDVFNASN